MSGSVWIGLLLLLGVLLLELTAPTKMTEGFQNLLVGPGGSSASKIQFPDKQNYLTMLVPKRADIGLNKEQGGYKQDRRFFADWADVQRIGAPNDFCRMVYPDGAAEEESFFACALGGTAGMSGISYRSKSVKQGLRRSRDDYMNVIRGDGRDAYCRILKGVDGKYDALCIAAEDTKFGDRDFPDPEPPEDIRTLLEFYHGCRFWLRLRDDMLDYVGEGKSTIRTNGNAAVDETPRPAITRGLYLNGVDQFLRIGDGPDLLLGTRGSLRQVRAFSVWVRFSEFTNNAHIFDFGDGPGQNNTFLGLLGAGDPDTANGAEIRPGPICQETTVPDHPTGAPYCREIRPQDLLLQSRGNIDAYTCVGPETVADPKKARPIETRPTEQADPNAPKSRATLLYEVWDGTLRKMRIKLNRVVPKDKWIHIAFTAKTMDAVRPDILVYINGNLWYTQESGFLPQVARTAKNYIGKSNWSDVDDGYELRDELMNGSVFDFRMYTRPLSEIQVKRILQWGMKHLGLTDVSN